VNKLGANGQARKGSRETRPRMVQAGDVRKPILVTALWLREACFAPCHRSAANFTYRFVLDGTSMNVLIYVRISFTVLLVFGRLSIICIKDKNKT